MRVAVLAGGRSSEHEVSLDVGRVGRATGLRGGRPRGRRGSSSRATGRGAYDGERDRRCAPAAGCSAPTSCSRSLHGPFGEDGTVQGLLELPRRAVRRRRRAGAARCAWTRSLFKELMAHAGLPQVDYVAVDEGVVDGAVARIERPRAAVLGQAGAARVVGRDRAGGATRASSRRALETAFGHDPRVIVEATRDGARGRVLGARADAPRRRRASPARSCSSRATAGTTTRPSTTPGGMELRRAGADLRRGARAGARAGRRGVPAASGCSGLARADFFVDGDDGAAQRAQHDARVHADERLREALGGERAAVPGARRPARGDRGRALRGASGGTGSEPR